jgi:hypothetical protein
LKGDANTHIIMARTEKDSTQRTKETKNVEQIWYKHFLSRGKNGKEELPDEFDQLHGPPQAIRLPCGTFYSTESTAKGTKP